MSLSPLSQQLLTGDVVAGRCLLSLVSLGNFLSLTIHPPPKKGVIPFCCFFFVAGGGGPHYMACSKVPHPPHLPEGGIPHIPPSYLSLLPILVPSLVGKGRHFIPLWRG